MGREIINYNEGGSKMETSRAAFTDGHDNHVPLSFRGPGGFVCLCQR